MMYKVDVVGLWVVLLSIFLIGFGCAATSSTAASFIIDGCTFVFEGSSIGVSSGECSSGIASGYFFCETGSPAISWATTDIGRGCSMGLDTYSLGDDFCCPSGMFCNETSAGSGLFRCDPRLAVCSDQSNEVDCNNTGCIWLDLSGECTDNARKKDCGYYTTQATCLDDRWDIGTSGIGTELCGSMIDCGGKTFGVPDGECGCQWNASAPLGKKCQLSMNVTEMFYSGTPDKFECSNVYELGNCTDGIQNVTWYSSSNIISGFGSGVIPPECLGVLGCSSGESTRFCGEPIIKLPGISLFSLLASLFIIGFYYLLLDKIKYKRGFNLL